MNCNNCKFFEQGETNDKGKATGYCHRLPHTKTWFENVDLLGDEGVSVEEFFASFPYVSGDDWCGEFKKLEEEA